MKKSLLAMGVAASLILGAISGAEAKPKKADLSQDEAWDFYQTNFFSFGVPKGWYIFHTSDSSQLANVPENIRDVIPGVCYVDAFCAISPDGKMILSGRDDLTPIEQRQALATNDESWIAFGKGKAEDMKEGCVTPPEILQNRVVRGAYRQLWMRMMYVNLEEKQIVTETIDHNYSFYRANGACSYNKAVVKQAVPLCEEFAKRITLRGAERNSTSQADLLPLTGLETRALAQLYAGRTVTAEQFAEVQPEMAARLNLRLARVNYLLSIEDVAEALLTGNGAPKDVAQSIEWYKQGASMGSGKSMHRLYEIYSSGEFLAPDTNQSLEYLQQAAMAGYELTDEEKAILAQ